MATIVKLGTAVVEWWYRTQAENRPYDSIKKISPERVAELKEKFPHLPECKDMVWNRREALLRLPRSVEKYIVENLIEDKRDVIMLSTMSNLIVFIVLNISSILYFQSNLVCAFFTFCNVFFFIERFILMLHYAAHRRLFRKKYYFLNKILPWVIAPFFGIPVAMYEMHHVVMHHTENNLFPGDLSSTEPHQRDSFASWLHYLAKYWACIVRLPAYAMKRGHWRFKEVAMGEFTFFATMVGLWYTGNGFLTFWLLALPMMIASLAMMFGNFSQHIFIDPRIVSMKQNKASYEYNCALAINVINTPENLYSFNDGYHITHHLNSRLHWTELAFHFYQNLERYAQFDPLVFEGVSFFDVGILVMTKNHKELYNRYVHLGQKKLTFDEFVDKITERLKPIGDRVIKGAVDSKTAQ